MNFLKIVPSALIVALCPAINCWAEMQCCFNVYDRKLLIEAGQTAYCYDVRQSAKVWYLQNSASLPAAKSLHAEKNPVTNNFLYTLNRESCPTTTDDARRTTLAPTGPGV